MKQRWIGLAVGFALVVTAVLMTPVPLGAAEPAGLSGSLRDGVVRGTLGNGMRVVIVPARLAPVVAINLNYLTGSNDSPEGFPGTAHALEHMMFRGSAGLDKDQLSELGALLGGNTNANTAETLTQYTHTVPNDDLGVVLRSEALRMRGLTLNEADWVQERGAISQEVSRNLSNPFYAYLTQVQGILFEGTPYVNDALGTRPSFERTDAAALRRFYDQWYAPNNAILVIAGDVQPAQAMAEAEAAFGGIPSRPLPDHPSTNLRPVQPQTLALPTNLPSGLVTLAYRMPGIRSQDFAAAEILGDVLNSQRGALYGLVPSGRALTARFSYQAKADVGVGLATAAFPRGSDPAPLLADLQRVIAEAAQGVPPELVEAAKRQEIAQLAFENDSISGLARSWSRALAVQGANSPEDLAQAYAAVTVADVNRLARQLLTPDQAVTAVLTPQSSGRPAAAAGFGGAESLINPPDKPVVLPAWAASAASSVRVPDPAPPPHVSELPNGLRLIVHPEKVSPTVSVYGRVRQVTEIQEPPGKEGIAVLMDQLFSYGTEARDRLAFRTALDDIGAQYDAGADFSLKVLTPHFEHGMRLLAENQLRPAFPPEAFAVLRGQFAQTLAGLGQSPDYQFQRAVNRAVVRDDDPTLRQPTPETAMALRHSDLLAYYAANFRPDLTTIVVIGDVTPDEARRVVTEAFGAWPARGPAPAIDLPPTGPNVASQARIIDGSSLQDSVLLSATLALPVTSPDRYALLLGNTILGSGFSSRLYRDLRTNSGYVYSVSSSVDWSRTRGRHTVSFGADPGNVDKARELVLRNLRDMQTTPVSVAELTRAKAQVLRRLPMQRASVGAIAGLYLRQAELGLPLDSQQIAAERYWATTAADIQQAFSTWLRPDDLVQVVKGPPPTP